MPLNQLPPCRTAVCQRPMHGGGGGGGGGGSTKPPHHHRLASRPAAGLVTATFALFDLAMVACSAGSKISSIEDPIFGNLMLGCNATNSYRRARDGWLLNNGAAAAAIRCREPH